jgi:L-iditol 2-dehydrogenase
MKAFQLTQPRTFHLVRVPSPHIDPDFRGMMLVKARWVSMCGSDIPFFTGSKRFEIYPMPVGAPVHECVGQVSESTAEGFQPGDYVLAIPDNNQGLAEHFIAQASRAVRLPASVAASPTSCLIQPLSTVLNAVDRLGDLSGRSVAVIGLGSIGLLFCWLLKKRGTTRVVGIDPLLYRCELAEKLGASTVFTTRSIELVHSAKVKPNLWNPPDICIEAVGHQTDTLNECIQLVAKQGTVLAFGVPDHLVYPIEFETFFRKNLTLQAAVTPDWIEYLEKGRDLFISSQSELEILVTHRLPIQSAAQAYDLYARHGQGIIKAVLNISSWKPNQIK